MNIMEIREHQMSTMSWQRVVITENSLLKGILLYTFKGGGPGGGIKSGISYLVCVCSITDSPIAVIFGICLLRRLDTKGTMSPLSCSRWETHYSGMSWNFEFQGKYVEGHISQIHSCNFEGVKSCAQYGRLDSVFIVMHMMFLSH